MSIFIPDEQYQYIIANMPICTLDLLLKNDQDQYLLGLRRNNPAKGIYFTPGGRIRKNESQKDALIRIAFEELRIDIQPSEVKLVGTYDHIYQENVWGQSGYGTHCINILYSWDLPKFFDLSNLPSEQHLNFKFFSKMNILSSDTVHENVKVPFRENLGVSA